MSRRLNKLIAELWNLDKDIERAETTLNKMRSKRAMLATVDIPEAMTEAGGRDFTTDDNLKCQVSYKIYGSLPSRENPDARMAAIDYLKKNDGAALIKSHVDITFAKGDIEAAARTARLIERRIKDGSIFAESQPIVEVDTEVNAMSLQAWGRARIAANLPTDMALVGLRGMTMATIKQVTPK
jgi:hypothetical protein